jgi:hypothetical protein
MTTGSSKEGAIQMKKLAAAVGALLFTAVVPLAHAGSASTRALNPQPLPSGKTMSANVQVNPPPIPPQAGGQGSQGVGLIEGFAIVVERSVDRANAIGRQQGVARGSIYMSQPARKH